MFSFLTASPLALATPASASDPEALRVLHVIDQTCGDAWCEGPYSFVFKNVQFDAEAKETKVSFQIGLEVEPDTNGESAPVLPTYDVSCTIPGYSSAEEIVRWQYVLDGNFYVALDECIKTVVQSLWE